MSVLLTALEFKIEELKQVYPLLTDDKFVVEQLLKTIGQVTGNHAFLAPKVELPPERVVTVEPVFVPVQIQAVHAPAPVEKKRKPLPKPTPPGPFTIRG